MKDEEEEEVQFIPTCGLYLSEGEGEEYLLATYCAGVISGDGILHPRFCCSGEKILVLPRAEFAAF